MNISFLKTLTLIGALSISLSGNSENRLSRSNQLVVYFSLNAVEQIAASRGVGQITPLRGREFRKFYGELSLNEIQKVSFSKMSTLLPEYPFAVVTRGQLFYSSDDNCSGVPNEINGVDISEACRNHDYCYRQLSTIKNSFEERQRFLTCNENFAIEIVERCSLQMKNCEMLAGEFKRFLDTASFPTYKCKQSLQASMIHDVFEKLIQNDELMLLIQRSMIFNFSEFQSNFRNYCQFILSKPWFQRLPSETYACTGFGSKGPCSLLK